MTKKTYFSFFQFSVEYAVKYYVGDWYRMTMEDIEGSRETYKAVKDAADNDKVCKLIFNLCKNVLV